MPQLAEVPPRWVLLLVLLLLLLVLLLVLLMLRPQPAQQSVQELALTVLAMAQELVLVQDMAPSDTGLAQVKN